MKEITDDQARALNRPTPYELERLEAKDRTWTEDLPHENGNYECWCTTCDRVFFGHKRRVTCKQCVVKLTPMQLELRAMEARVDWAAYKDPEKREIAFRVGYEFAMRSIEGVASMVKLLEAARECVADGQRPSHAELLHEIDLLLKVARDRGMLK